MNELEQDEAWICKTRGDVIVSAKSLMQGHSDLADFIKDLDSYIAAQDVPVAIPLSQPPKEESKEIFDEINFISEPTDALRIVQSEPTPPHQQQGGEETEQGVIQKFELKGNEVHKYISATLNKSAFLDALRKKEVKKPTLFVTEDGESVYEGMRVWYVNALFDLEFYDFVNRGFKDDLTHFDLRL